MERLAILGLGLMGGSLGLAARRAGVAREVLGYARREATRQRALEEGVVDRVCAAPEEAVREADMAVLCLPVLVISEMARRCAPHFGKDCVVSDVGSTKGQLADELDEVFSHGGAVFVGSHPVAGSERTGIEAARPDLYRDATVVVTPTANSPADALERVLGLWSALGGRVRVMDPHAHDEVIARTSHLPHLVAAALARSVLRDPAEEVMDLCGTGFGDTTRIAAGSEDMWHDIVKSNRTAVSRELESFREVLEEMRGQVERGDFDALRQSLAAGRARRRAWERRREATE